MTIEVTTQILDDWATNSDGPVALHLKQTLVPVEGEGGIIFPPTYADIGYNIDTLSDGTRVATIDSVGSQANRLEPLFKCASENRGEWLVPQIEIVIREEPCGECDACKDDSTRNRKSKIDCTNRRKVKRSILDLAHRSADAVVQASPGLAEIVAKAFKSLEDGDAGPLCAIAPTSLVFGFWDSRGESGEKRPRLVRSIIRAWDVEPIHGAAQFNSVWKALDEEQRKELEKAGKKEKKLSTAGLKDAPATFRKVSKTAAKNMHEFCDGSPNPERRVLGGVIARGSIERNVTVNLLALRGLRGNNDEETKAIRKLLLGLALYAATADFELFLREGCLLRYSGRDEWHQVPRRGDPILISLADARDTIKAYALNTAGHFRKNWPERLEYSFNLREAQKLLAKTKDEEADEEQ